MTQPPQRDERFLSRWSRLKRAHARGEDSPDGMAGATPAGAGGMPAQTSAQLPAQGLAEVSASTGAEPSPSSAAAPALPSVESLGIESDYTPFFQPRVPEALRRAAVKKLFADPHFNEMDGLDVYIDDYSKFEPIPEDMLRRLPAARGFFEPGKISGFIDEPVALAGDGLLPEGQAAPAPAVASAIDGNRDGGMAAPVADDPADGAAASLESVAPSVRGLSSTSTDFIEHGASVEHGVPVASALPALPGARTTAPSDLQSTDSASPPSGSR